MRFVIYLIRDTMCRILFCLLSFVILMHNDVIAQKPPQILDISPNQTKFNLDPVEFICKVADVIGYQVLWKRISATPRSVTELISTNTLVNISDARFSVTFDRFASSFNLKITEVRPSDVGGYICEIPLDRDHSTTRYTRLFELLERPFFYGNSSAMRIVVNVTEDVTIECYAGGSPPPDILIKREDEIPLRGNVPSFDGNVLKIENITKREEANYLCQATIAGATATKKTFIEVHAPPIIAVCYLNVLYYPDFSAMVECTIESHVRPEVSWFKDEQQLSNGTNFNMTLMPRGELFIAKLQIDSSTVEYGYYSIKAANPIGEEETTVGFLTRVPASCPEMSCPTSSCFVYILLLVIFLIVIVIMVVVGVVYVKKTRQYRKEGNRPSGVTYRLPKNDD